jgi:hypothetical protein
VRFLDLPAAKIGRLGETLAAELLASAGAGVIATFRNSEDAAPVIEKSGRRIVLPDLDVSIAGRTFSVEIKTYQKPAKNRSHGCMVHGVPVRSFDQYVSCEVERGIPVHLGVLEVDSGKLLLGRDPISRMSPRYPCQCSADCDSVRPHACEFRARWGNSYPQWYFRRDSMEEVLSLTGSSLANLQDQHRRFSPAIKRKAAEPTADHPAPVGIVWDWICLRCDATGRGHADAHACPPGRAHVGDFWVTRLQLVSHGRTRDQIRDAISRPWPRAEMVRLLGDRWRP